MQGIKSSRASCMNRREEKWKLGWVSRWCSDTKGLALTGMDVRKGRKWSMVEVEFVARCLVAKREMRHQRGRFGPPGTGT